MPIFYYPHVVGEDGRARGLYLEYKDAREAATAVEKLEAIYGEDQIVLISKRRKAEDGD